VTNIQQGHAPDEVYERARSAFSEPELKATSFSHYSGGKQVAEEGFVSGERPEKHTAGVEVHVDIAGLTGRLKSRSRKKQGCD
jgi:hypothetical protein